MTKQNDFYRLFKNSIGQKIANTIANKDFNGDPAFKKKIKNSIMNDELQEDGTIVIEVATNRSQDQNIQHIANGIELILTCGACPEQYDAFYKGKEVGYLRLRCGEFTVNYPNYEGETIFKSDPDGDGKFEDYEREKHLNDARLAIAQEIAKGD